MCKVLAKPVEVQNSLARSRLHYAVYGMRYDNPCGINHCSSFTNVTFDNRFRVRNRVLEALQYVVLLT